MVTSWVHISNWYRDNPEKACLESMLTILVQSCEGVIVKVVNRENAWEVIYLGESDKFVRRLGKSGSVWLTDVAGAVKKASADCSGKARPQGEPRCSQLSLYFSPPWLFLCQLFLRYFPSTAEPVLLFAALSVSFYWISRSGTFLKAGIKEIDWDTV